MAHVQNQAWPTSRALERVGITSVRMPRICIADLETSWKKSASRIVLIWREECTNATADGMQERIDVMGTRKVRLEFVFLFEIAGSAWATFFGETSMKPGPGSGA
jgi:hypothetical protein